MLTPFAQRMVIDKTDLVIPVLVIDHIERPTEN
jgi:hypothetical protein